MCVSSVFTIALYHILSTFSSRRRAHHIFPNLEHFRPAPNVTASAPAVCRGRCRPRTTLTGYYKGHPCDTNPGTAPFRIKPAFLCRLRFFPILCPAQDRSFLPFTFLLWFFLRLVIALFFFFFFFGAETWPGQFAFVLPSEKLLHKPSPRVYPRKSGYR